MKMKKAEKGTALGMKSIKAGFDKNPGVTRADVIVAAKKEARSGTKLKKQAATAIAMKKAGKAPKKKMQYGGDAASMVPTMKKGGTKKKYEHGGTVSMQLGSYDRQIGKNYTGKATKAVGLTKAKYGKTIMKGGGKCKNGC
jgi:hypothetical protein